MAEFRRGRDEVESPPWRPQLHNSSLARLGGLELQFGEPRVKAAAGRKRGVRALLHDAAVVEHQNAVAGQHRRQADARSRWWCGLASVFRSACCTSVSLSASSEEVASSSSSSGASRKMARAMAMRWRWPPESVMPRSPTGVSKPCGMRAMNSAARAASAARSISASLAPGRPKRMFSRTLPANTAASCGTSAMRERTSARVGLGQAHAVERHAAGERIVEAQDEMKHRAFAGAGRTDQRELFARPHVEGDAVEHRRVGARRIKKAHIAELDLAARGRRQLHGLRRRRDRPARCPESRTAARPRLSACEISPHTCDSSPKPPAANTA